MCNLSVIAMAFGSQLIRVHLFASCDCAQKQFNVVRQRLSGSIKPCCLPWVCNLPQYFLQVV